MGLAVGLPMPDRGPSPSDPAPVDGVDLHAECSSEGAGGDLCDTVRVGPRLAFLLSDIAGRRPEVSPIAAEVRRVFREVAAELLSAADLNLMEATETLILSLNQALIGAAKGVRFAPTMVGCYDVQLGVLAYINAGGQTALLHDSEGTRALPNVSVPLGLFTHLAYDASIQAFEPGAVLLAVTKGVTECLRGGKPFGPQGVIDVLQASNGGSAKVLCHAVLNAAHQFERRRWAWLPLQRRPARQELKDDRTAFALVRPV